MEHQPIKHDRRKCIVPGCPSTRKEKHHVFPKDEMQGRVWLEAVRNPMLQHLTYKQIYDNGYRVCTLHFRKEDYLRGQRNIFSEKTIPSLNLPGKNDNFTLTVLPEKISIDLSDDDEKLPSSVAEIEFPPLTHRSWFSGSRDSDLSMKSNSTHVEDEKGVKIKLEVFPEDDYQNVENEDGNSKVFRVLEKSVQSDQNVAVKKNVNSALSVEAGVELKTPKLERENATMGFETRGSKCLVREPTVSDKNTREIDDEVSQSKEELDNCKISDEKMSALTTLQRKFINMILRNADRESYSQRYTIDEKMLCLSIYKRSAATYNYLGSFLPLPSPSSLRSMLMKIRLDTGVTQIMHELLNDAAKELIDPQDKVCVLMWDKVPLDLHLQYSPEKDKVIGFEDWGTCRSSKYAEHALVFMLRGIKTGWKIPLAYYLCAGHVANGQMARCIEEVVRTVTKAGFDIVASLCDQDSLNLKAIKSLQLETDEVREMKNIAKYWTILVDEVEFVPLFDLPDMLKCVRNNLLEKHLEFDHKPNAEAKDRKFVKWDHVVEAYEVDQYAPSFNRAVPELTENHVLPEKIDRTSVKLVTDVFSKKLSCFMYLLARSPGVWDTVNGAVILPQDIKHTAFILSFFDDIADGINGDRRQSDNCLNVPWTKKSYHDTFFEEAIAKVKKMQWIDPQTKERVKTDIPCLVNLTNTLRGFRIVWKKLQHLGFTSFNTRYLNRGPLDDFFATVNSYDFECNQPTSFQFETIFKTVLISNLMSESTPGENCEEDGGKFLFSCLDMLNHGSVGKTDNDDVIDTDESEHNDTVSEEYPVFPVPANKQSHIDSGDLLESLEDALPSIGSCSACIKSFHKASLKNPHSTRFREAHQDANRILGRMLHMRLSMKRLETRAARWLSPKISLSFVSCVDHKNSICALFKKLCFEQYCEEILAYLNRILKGAIPPRKGNVCPLIAEAFHCCQERKITQERYLETSKALAMKRNTAYELIRSEFAVPPVESQRGTSKKERLNNSQAAALPALSQTVSSAKETCSRKRYYDDPPATAEQIPVKIPLIYSKINFKLKTSRCESKCDSQKFAEDPT